MKIMRKVLVGALFGMLAVPAMAVSVWNYGAANSGGLNPGNGTSNFGGLSITGSGGSAAGNAVTAGITAIQGAQTSGSTIGTGQLFWYGTSVGVGTEAAPYHAIDNNGGAYEFVLLNFNSKVALNAVTVGFNGIDNATPNLARATVLAFTGTPPVNAVPNITNGNDTWGNLTSAWDSVNNIGGWQVIANSIDTGTPVNNTASFNAGNATTSSYWLVGAYNPLFQNAGAAAPNPSDLFKFVSVTGCAVADTTSTGCTPGSGGGRVPEPGSIALFGLALAGLAAFRKRRQA